MPDTITLDIPAHLAAAAQATPEELKIELAIHLYTQDRLTLEEASELAGKRKEEFNQWANRKFAREEFDSSRLLSIVWI